MTVAINGKVFQKSFLYKCSILGNIDYSSTPRQLNSSFHVLVLSCITVVSVIIFGFWKEQAQLYQFFFPLESQLTSRALSFSIRSAFICKKKGCTTAFLFTISSEVSISSRTQPQFLVTENKEKSQATRQKSQCIQCALEPSIGVLLELGLRIVNNGRGRDSVRGVEPRLLSKPQAPSKIGSAEKRADFFERKIIRRRSDF